MFLTVLGCVAAIVVLKFLYGWVSRPRTNVHVHIAASQTPPTYYPVPFVVPQAVPDVHYVDDDGELHGMIDDYYRENGPRS
jgi:hypothetical protein